MLKLKVLRRISIVPIKKMMRDLAESISSIRAEEILWPGLTHAGNVLILKCSASSKLQPVISQGFKNEGRKENAWLRCFHLLAPQQHLTSKDSSFLLKSCFHSDPPHWKILSEMFSKIKINPPTYFKISFLQFSILLFSRTWNRTNPAKSWKYFAANLPFLKTNFLLLYEKFTSR